MPEDQAGNALAGSPLDGAVKERAYAPALGSLRLESEDYSNFLDEAVANGTDLVYEWDIRSGALRFVGPVDQLLGYGPGELTLTYRTWLTALHPEDRERVEDRIRAHIEDGAPFFEEYRMVRKDGTERWWSDRGRVLRDAQGAPERWVGMINDVTDRRTMEEALSRSREERDVILGTVDTPVLARDSSGRIVFANTAAARHFGYASPEALIAAPRGALTERFALADEQGRAQAPEDFPGLVPFKEYNPEGVVIRFMDRQDGRVFWSVANSTTVLDARDKVRLTITALHDITALKRAQLELARSRDELEVILRTMDSACTAQDAAGNLIFANRAAALLLGCSTPEEVIRLGYPYMVERFEMVDADGRPFPPGHYPSKRALNGEAVTGVLMGYRDKVTGRVGWSIVNGTPVFDGAGRVRLTINVFHDITALKRAEDAQGRHLRYMESADAVARAAESALDAEKVLPAALEKVLEVMQCERALLVHPADPEAADFRIPFSASRGAEPGELKLPKETPFREVIRIALDQDRPSAIGPGGSLPDPAFWSDVLGAESLLAVAVRPRAGKPWLLCLMRAPGAPAWVHEEETLFRDIASRITAALGNMLLYKDLRRSEEKYRTLFERSLDGVFRCAPDGTILDSNPALVELLGYPSRAALVGVAQRQLLPAGGASEGRSGRRDPFIVELRRRDGGKVWVEVIAQAVRRSDGEVVCFEGMVRDIDDRKRTEEALKESEEVLRQAQKMEAVGRLAGGVAHDFNNLLTAINGFGDLLLMQVPKDDPRRMHVEEIRKAGERAAGLTSQLLSFSRKQVLAPRRLDLGAVVAGMEPMLRRLIGENIEFETVLAPDLPPVTADPNQAEQIVMNLALNARDAMPTGGRLRISTSSRKLGGGISRSKLEVEDGEYVVLSVQDTGTGMDEETKARLFEPFFTTKDKDKGTGLGLSMVYGAVKQGKGAIEVETRKGRGTTFQVLLPAAARGEPAPVPARPTGKLPIGGQGTETILLVEDEDAVRRLVRDVLLFNGYKVLEAPGGEKALEVAEAHEAVIHLLLTDVVMGGMSGRELAEHLRVVRPDVRVLYMSGYTEDAIIRHGVEAAQTAFIGKPFTPVALAAKVREVLSVSPETAAQQS